MLQQQRQRRRLRGSSIIFSQIFLVILWYSPETCTAFTSRTTSYGAFGTTSVSTIRSTQNPRDLTKLSIFGAEAVQEDQGIPYVIERISRKPSDDLFRDIAEMCINVFFKEQLNAKPEDRLAPWKEAQISYLKNLQTADLRRRRRIYPETNEMFLAYEVLPVESETTAMEKPLILDLEQVQNMPRTKNSGEYVRGELIGFCEITQRPYGLGRAEGALYDDEPAPPIRPILTNLAVKQGVRKYGIGSKLLDQCEQHVAEGWKLGEIVLEVEDYNTRALEFYANRDYKMLFDDPASRRFDVGGIVLRKVRCTRKVFRKVLSEVEPGSSKGAVTIDLDFFRRFRQTVGVR
eukprot:scaffold26366_cov117-Cylindrotheca_fusiformis.AAC.7